jgi:hypothetical protein
LVPAPKEKLVVGVSSGDNVAIDSEHGQNLLKPSGPPHCEHGPLMGLGPTGRVKI